MVNVYPEVKQTQAQFKQQTRKEAWHEFIEEFWSKWKKRTNCPTGDMTRYCKQSKEERVFSVTPSNPFELSGYVNFRELGRIEHDRQVRLPQK